MALTIGGATGRALGVLMAVALLVPGVLLWAGLGVVSTAVPFPAEGVVESLFPVLERMSDRSLPLGILAPGVLFSGVFIVIGLLGLYRALLRPDYTVTVRGGGGGGRP
jgi:hypothetical protein